MFWQAGFWADGFWSTQFWTESEIEVAAGPSIRFTSPRREAAFVSAGRRLSLTSARR